VSRRLVPNGGRIRGSPPGQSKPQLKSLFSAGGAGGVTPSQFATAGLTRVVDRPVIDRTELGDTLYDWAIAWPPESPAQASAATDLPSSVFSGFENNSA
jgi:hypothetical protein